MKALEDIIKTLIEKNALGRISDEWFFTLSAEYEAEQVALKERLSELEAKLNKAHEDKHNVEQFVGLIDKYIGLETLNARILIFDEQTSGLDLRLSISSNWMAEKSSD